MIIRCDSSWQRWEKSRFSPLQFHFKRWLCWAAKGRCRDVLQWTADLSPQICQRFFRLICGMTGSQLLQGTGCIVGAAASIHLSGPTVIGSTGARLIFNTWIYFPFYLTNSSHSFIQWEWHISSMWINVFDWEVLWSCEICLLLLSVKSQSHWELRLCPWSLYSEF